MNKKASHLVILFLLASLSVFIISACWLRFEHSLPSTNNSSIIANCRLVQHKMGKICIPKNPERIVTVALPTLGNLLALGIKPVASTGYDRNSSDFPKYLEEKIDGVEALGRNQPSIEKLLLLKPDLVIGWEHLVAYSQVAKIAPTVLHEWKATTSWRKHFNFIANILEKQEAAQQIWNRYYKRIAELKAALGVRYQNKTISILTLYKSGMPHSEVKNSFAGSILNDTGLRRPEAQDVEAPLGWIEFSSELVEKADGDVLFVISYKNDINGLDRLRKNPLWSRLRAVQQNRVYFVNTETWRGSSLLAADAVINDLFKYLVNTP